MATQQELLIKIRGDISDIQSKLVQIQQTTQKSNKKFEGLKETLVKVGKIGAAALGSVSAATAALIKIGSDYSNEVQQTAFLMGRLDSTTQDLINTKAAESSALGMTSKQYTDSAASLGTFMKSMGLTTDAANDLIPQMVQLAADGAAFADVPVSDAMDAISSAAMGNYEALGKLNIEMSDNLINNSTFAKELGKTTSQMSTAEKTQAIYNTMLERGSHLTGFAASESGNFSTQLNLTKTKMFEAAGALGEKLLPLVTPFVTKLGEMADKLKAGVDKFSEIYDATGSFSEGLQAALDMMGATGLSDFVGKLKEMYDWISQIPDKLKEWEQPLTVATIMIGSLAIAFGAYWLAQNAALISTGIGVGLLTAWSAICGVASAVTSVLAGAVAFLTSPITLVILAIGAAIAIGYLLVKNWDEVSAWIKSTWESIKAKAVELWGALKSWFAETWEAIKNKIKEAWESIKQYFSELWTGIKDTIVSVWTSIRDWFAEIWSSIYSVIEPIINIIKTLIITVWQAIQIAIALVLTAIFATIKVIWDGIKAVITTVMGLISSIISTIWNAIKSCILTVLNVIMSIVSTIWNGIKDIISSIITAISSIISSIWNSIKEKISSVLNAISTIVSSIFNSVKSNVSSIWGNIKGVISGVVDGIKSLVSSGFNWVSDKVKSICNGLKSVVIGIWKGIGTGIQSVVNGIISLINGMVNALNKISFDVPSWVPVMGGKKFGFNIPTVPKVSWFQTGGIFTGASIIGVGENGDEAVVPLSNKTRMRPFAEAVASFMADSESTTPVSTGLTTINLNGSYMFQDKDSMDYFLNRMALAVQRG